MEKILLLAAAAILTCGTVSAQEESQIAKDSTIVKTADGHTEDGKMQKYRRSSLYSVLIAHSSFNYGDVVKETFVSIPTPDKFNSHDVAAKIFESSSAKMIKNPKKKEELNQTDIAAFIEEHDVARRMVAKWFNRNAETGMFDTSYIEECGISSASWADKAEASQGILGEDQLKTQIGEELIGKTFLLVNDIVFVDKGEQSAKASGWIKAIGGIAGAALGSSAISDLADTAGDLANEVDGFTVKIVSYLFRLDWNQNIMNTLYNDYWIYEEDSPEVVAEKRAAFENSDLFKLTYIGQTETQAGNLASKSLAQKSKEEQMLKVCTRAIDKSIVELQREYDEFKVNVPIQKISEDKKTCTIPVGLKEGVNEKSVYKAVELVQDETGTYTYKTIATLKPVKGQIWDNRFGAAEDAAAIAAGEAKGTEEDAAGNAALTATTFEITSGANNIMEGTLVREETIKRDK